MAFLKLSIPAFVSLGFVISAGLISPLRSYGQESQTSALRVALDSPAKLKIGAAVHARTIEPFYVANQLILPSGTKILGEVVSVSAVDRKQRWTAISHGDFTPLHRARIQFEKLSTEDGSEISILTTAAEPSTGILHFHSTAQKHQSIFQRAWSDLMGRKNQAVDTITAPGKIDRAKKYVYAQLPYHPQALDTGTNYDVSFAQPLRSLPELRGGIIGRAQPHELNRVTVLHARLQQDLTSKNAKRDDDVSALVTQPAFDAQGKIEVPQGSFLRGRVLQARAARKLGRDGALRYTFNRLDFPEGFQQKISGVATGMDGSAAQGVRLDPEGGVKPDTNKGIFLPLALGLLASHSIGDDDGGAGAGGASSNGFGLIGRIIAISAGTPRVGSVMGFITAARVVYARFLAHGHDVAFSKNSEVEVEVGPVRPISQPREGLSPPPPL